MLIFSPPSTYPAGRKAHAAKFLAAAILGLTLNGSTVALQTEAASAASTRTLVVVLRNAARHLLSVVHQKDILPHHQTLADQVLRALPPLCRNNLKNFHVTYERNPNNRGLGGESTMIVTGNVPKNEFRALIIHECGHITDLGGLRGSDLSKPSMFADGTTPIRSDDPSILFYQISWMATNMMQPGATTADFVSGYATVDPFEDFAETYAYYVLQQKEFAKLTIGSPVLRAKYDFMSRMVFAGSPKIAEGTSKRGDSVPWDVTRLPYVWHAAW